MANKATINADTNTISIEVDILPVEAFVQSRRGNSLLITGKTWIEVEGEPVRVAITACAPVTWDGQLGSGMSFSEWKKEYE